ncbi:hypothetical protein C7B62_09980 [Pleurocapsa sp. CCALA 161]|uniref:hypothetical protein n=1 Tax=Pleurocapsa sp. CCALA 161 TaxID=2107688 RepID=UPI000D07B345|nr:hypothetical protein [Pleurocapsa sp. CCALA 161]PSB10335.1 hypothetical protein C7B62_09980 [Pleurocapsa sp. CCALA 161]
MANVRGVWGSGVTLAADFLHQSGLIHYQCGKIAILDRQNWEDAACECYQLCHDNYYIGNKFAINIHFLLSLNKIFQAGTPTKRAEYLADL